MKRVFLLAILASVALAQAWAVDAYVYCSWGAIFSQQPDTVIQDVEVNQKDFCEFELKAPKQASKEIKNLLKKNALAVALEGGQWLANSEYFKKNDFAGAASLKSYVPLYFNNKIVYLQLMRSKRNQAWAVAFDDENIFYELIDSGVSAADITEMAATDISDAYFYHVDFSSKEICRVDYFYMDMLLSPYMDLLRRFDSMSDNEYPYVINSFFMDYIDRIEQDPEVPYLFE